MAVRGLFFRRLRLVQSSYHLSVRHVRSVKAGKRSASEDYADYLHEDEEFQYTGFGGVRKDASNVPQRHGAFEIERKAKLVGFDTPLPKLLTKHSSQYVKDNEIPTFHENDTRERETQTEFNEKTNENLKKKTKAGHEKETQPKFEKKIKKFEIKTVQRAKPELNDEEHKTALDAVKAERFAMEPPASKKIDSKGFRILNVEVIPQLHTMDREEIYKCLLRRVLFESPELLVFDKPYGMSMHGGGTCGADDIHSLTAYLPQLAEFFKVKKLYPVHRLDKYVTGVLCIAKSSEIADVVETLFEARQVKKSYVAITRGVPKELKGTIDLPIAVGTINKQERMVIVPQPDTAQHKSLPKFKRIFQAKTDYEVVKFRENRAYIKLSPLTGYKHQIRVHLGFGLRCPILGDHKYSDVRYMAPQKLPGNMLDALHIRQEKVRDVPLHLHSRSLTLPGILKGGKNLIVHSPLPRFFSKNLKRLDLD